jgi:uncharacterized protein (DUF1778 family)
MKTNQAARLELRLSKEQKDYFEQMAELGGFKTLTDFMVHAADKEAKRVQKEKETILATPADWKLFIETMLNPPAPNAALRRAFKRYKKAVSSK